MARRRKRCDRGDIFSASQLPPAVNPTYTARLPAAKPQCPCEATAQPPDRNGREAEVAGRQLHLGSLRLSL